MSRIRPRGIARHPLARGLRLALTTLVVALSVEFAHGSAQGVATTAGEAAAASRTAASALVTDGYPRLSLVNDLAGPDWQRLEKYNAVSGAGGSIRNVERAKSDLQGKGRTMTALRYFSAQAYQGDQISMPWTEIYPGHWLFSAGTTTTAPVSASAVSIPVVSGVPFQAYVGYYAMIWNGTATNISLTPDDPGFWARAENVKITAVGAASITVQRGYDPGAQTFSGGLALTHPTGSRVAVHVPGSNIPIEPAVWNYNESTSSPRDSAGRQLPEVLGAWLGQHLNDLYDSATRTYTSYPAAFDGVLFDSNSYFIRSRMDGMVDINNDLIADGGVLQAGHSAWGEGLDAMYARARQALGPDIRLVGGVANSRGLAHLNGTQFEVFPSGSRSVLGYNKWDATLARYLIWMEDAGATPLHTEIFSVFGTAQYPSCGPGIAQGSNADFRFGLGSALLAGGYYAYDNGCFGDYWWDEYSVDLDTGNAVPTSDGVDAVAAHRGYLGQPLGAPRRLLDPTSGANLLSTAAWTLATSGGGSATLSASGTGASVSISSPGKARTDIVVRDRPFSLVGGREYTLSFWAKADNGRTTVDVGRDVDVAVGPPGGLVELGTEFVTSEWRQYWVDFVAPADTISSSLVFRVGGELGTVWLDQVKLYEGASALWRRDFEQGTVIVNGSWQTQTVSLGATFRKIKGMQDPVNDGSLVTSITLAPHDAVILLRTQPYKAVWQSHNTPSSMIAGSLNTVSLGFANGGTLTWDPAGTNPVHLSYHWLHGACPGSSTAVWDGVRTNLPTQVPPGSYVNGLSAQVRAPSAPGTFCLTYDLVREFITWFAWQGSPPFSVTVQVQ